MGRHANPDIRRAFAEFQDSDTPTKCNKVRCLHCGFVRAKNTTRQIEHLQECQAYLTSAEAQAHLTQAQPNGPTMEAASTQPSNQILTGQAPNPNLQIHRRGPNNKRARESQPIAPNIIVPTYHAPSITAHLLTTYASQFRQATQQPFLSHAGCGSLAAGPLSQWLVQDGHYSRGYIRFIGQLLAKIRLPQTPNSQFHPMYRTMDLLISAINNMRREMQFFEITATKYGLAFGSDGPTPVTRAILDLFVSASSSSASLLEGMVVLWGFEHCYRSAWQFASSFNTTLPAPSSDTHILALHQALIPNWTSPQFSKFVDASRALVDELANITTARDGKEESDRCEEIFRQICWLEQRSWPIVNGMGEESENPRLASHLGNMDNSTYSSSPMNQNINGNSGNAGFNPPGVNGQMNGSMNNNMPVNRMNGPLNNQMNGPIPTGVNASQIANANISGSEETPGTDGRSTFGLDNDNDIDGDGE